MQTDTQAIADKISALSAMFVGLERYDRLKSLYLREVDRRLADLRAGRSQQAQNFALTAPSGSGKTTALRHLEDAVRQQLDASDFPEGRTLHLELPSNITLKMLGILLLRKLGFDFQNETRSEAYIWDLLKFQFIENNVLFLFLDEAQHLNARHKKKDQNVVDKIKSVSQDQDWPVSVFLSGIDELQEVINRDDQLERRTKSVRFAPLDLRYDTEEILGMVHSYVEHAGLEFGIEPSEYQSAGQRIIHSANYQYGRAILLTISAIENALYEGQPSLDIGQFAKAYEQQKSCGDAYNPFIVHDFTQIDPTRSFGPEGPEL